MYQQSAGIYDLLYVGAGIKDYGADVAHLRGVVEEACPGARTWLDVACGTGAHLAVLQHWYHVEGVDLSPAMLEVARRRLPGVPLRMGDMRTLDLGRTFDVVSCLFSSIGHATGPGELEAAIGRLAAHVGRPGMLILDGWIRPDAWRDDFQGDPDLASDLQTSVVRLAMARRSGSITEIEMHYMVRAKGSIEHFSETHRLALHTTATYVAAVEGAGLAAQVVPDYMPNRDRIIGVRE